MLLETLDVKKNDILIYSENKFDFENNFKIIYKKAASKKPFNISFWEVGEYINSLLPKNMILYRLLTNIPDFNARLTKFGTLIQIDNSPEIIYYDPVFAVKELERLDGIIDFQSFRFKIHQIGLSSSSMQNGFQNYRELYHFDLKADEAKYQNDKVYAEAIFAFDNDFTDAPDITASGNINEQVPSEKVNSYKPLNLVLSEDKNTQLKDMQKLDVFPDMSIASEAGQKINYDEYEGAGSNIEPAGSKYESSMGEFLKRQKLKQACQPASSNSDNLLTLFKSANSYVSTRSGESVILRFGKKEE